MSQNSFAFNHEQILKPYRFNLAYAEDLVVDVPDNLLFHSPGPGLENHPGFTLGHLVTGSGLTARYLGGAYDIPDGWDERFRRKGPGDPRRPESDPIDAPSKDSLLAELKRQHGIVEELIVALDPSRFEEPCEWRLDGYFPTVGDMLSFMCVTHEAMHLAQVAAWRRAMNLESSLGRL